MPRMPRWRRRRELPSPSIRELDRPADEHRRGSLALAWPSVLRRSTEYFCSAKVRCSRPPDGGGPMAAGCRSDGPRALRTFLRRFARAGKDNGKSFRRSPPARPGYETSAALAAAAPKVYKEPGERPVLRRFPRGESGKPRCEPPGTMLSSAEQEHEKAQLPTSGKLPVSQSRR